MSPDRLRTAGWTVEEWPDGGYAAIHKHSLLLIIGLANGDTVYAVPAKADQTVVKGFRP